jgi:aminoglycoside 6'-N-acetyltransferase I
VVAANQFRVRLATRSDLASLTPMRTALWPESTSEHHSAELTRILDGSSPRVYPLFIFVAEEPDGALMGFLEVNLRSAADGCDESRPVAYVEGWFVTDSRRRRGVGAALLAAAEDWARAQGCTEMASDTSIDNQLSQRVHQASGFAVTARSVLYKKQL